MGDRSDVFAGYALGDKGQSLVEYVLILALASVVVVLVLRGLAGV